MAEFTITVRSILASYAGYSQYESDYKKIIRDGRTKFFDFDYPIYDEDYRPVLETKILKHFFMREIGFDTVGEFKLHLDETLNRIMPLYNNLYKHASMDFNPLITTDMTTSNTGGRQATTTGSNQTSTTTNTSDSTTSSGSASALHKMADTPQSAVSGLLDDSYLTSASSDDSSTGSTASTTASSGTTGNGSSTTQADSTESYVSHMTGYSGRSAISLIKEYQENLIGIDGMIIDELNSLFMGLWV